MPSLRTLQLPLADAPRCHAHRAHQAEAGDLRHPYLHRPRGGGCQTEAVSQARHALVLHVDAARDEPLVLLSDDAVREGDVLSVVHVVVGVEMLFGDDDG